MTNYKFLVKIGVTRTNGNGGLTGGRKSLRMSNCGHAALDWRTAERAGLRYIVDGVKLVAADEELAHHMTKELYPAIAAKHDTTTSRVERCIRHAIEWAYTNGNPDMLKHYLGNIAAYDKGKATNAAFIAGLASWCRE